MFVTKEKNGYYYIYYNNPITNKRTKVSTGFKNSNQANKFFADFKKEQEQKKEGIKQISISEFTEIFTSYKKNYVTEEVLLSYEKELKQFDKFHNGKLRLHEIKQEHIDNYSSRLYNEKYAPQSIKIKLSRLATAFKFARKNKYLASDLETPKIKITQTEKEYLSRQEFNTLLDNCNSSDLKDIITVAFLTGLRLQEIINLQWDSVSLKNRNLILNNKTHITKNRKIATIPLNTEAFNIIQKRLINGMPDYIFTFNTRKWNKMTLQLSFKRLALQVFPNKKITFHNLRHSFASNLVIGGVPIYTVSKLLRHSSISTTQIYAHLATDNLQDVLECLSINRETEKEKIFINNN